ncbi:MAG TPA: hypothetical protein VMT00_02425 [Thermoanaerobaculia bacterium]|nr:hypothetical protein [Thermoanaerobaculia bacterium]
MNDLLMRIDQPKAGDADDDAADQLTEDRRLAEALGNLSKQFRRHEDGDQGQQEMRNVHAGCGRA